MFKRSRKILAQLLSNNYGGGGGASVLDGATFFAQLTKSLVLNRGTGSPTYTGATPKTVQNNDGFLVATLSGEARFQGARRVRNLISGSTENSSAWSTLLTGAWTNNSVSAPDGSMTGMTANLPAVNDQTRFGTTFFATTTGNSYLGSVWVRADSPGNITITDAYNSISTNVIAVTTSWTRVSTSVGIGAGGASQYTLKRSAGQLATVYVWHPQAEDVTSQTTQTAGEYVSVGVLSSPWHGAGVDSVKYFDTDIVGNPIPLTTLKGYLAEGARTNLCLQSNAFTTTWTNTSAAPTQNAIGPDGATSAWTLTDSSGAAAAKIAQGVTRTAATWTTSIFVKKTTGATTFPVIYDYSSVDSKIALVTIDTNNGIATAWTSFTGLTIASGLTARCVSHNDSFWRVEFSFTATAQSWEVDIFPAAAASATYAGPSLDATLQGSAVFYGAQVELGAFASSYIATTTIAAARNADVLYYPNTANIADAAGWAYAEVSSASNNAFAISTSTNVLNGAPLAWNAFNIFLQDSAGGHYFGNQPFPTSLVKKLATTWSASANFSQGAQGGAAGTASAYNGTMVRTNILIGFDNTTSATNNTFGTIRNVRIGQRALSSSELQAVTS